MAKFEVWFNPETVKEPKGSTIFISFNEIRGNMIFTEKGNNLLLFLLEDDADKLAFAIQCNLQQVEMAKKEE